MSQCRLFGVGRLAIGSIILTMIGLFVLGSSSNAAEIGHFWVFLKDKGFTTANLDSALMAGEKSLTSKARARRTRLGNSHLINENDLPLSQEYIRALVSTPDVRIRHLSRCLTAVSVEADPSALNTIRAFPFVRDVRQVAVGHAPTEPIVEDQGEPLPPARDHNFNYGNSLRQDSFLNVPDLHDEGLMGDGVLIGMCDAGFDNLQHVCFAHLNVVAAWDFVNNNAGVGNENDMGNGEHGTRTLSILAGFDPGHLIGIAPYASFILAKTENTEWERRVEEDAWIAAAEWMDSLGVEVISSSLGYMDWYQYRDLDGRTAPITIAADRAVEAGIVVVNAMGNTGGNHYPADKLITPADGFNVLYIGATNRDSSLAGFSSHGPTYDGRIKPDFVTFGSSVIFASSANNHDYGGGAGTSFSTPAIAGLCALMIEHDPLLNPTTLRELLRSVADNRDQPDTLYGWGIPDGLAAMQAAGHHHTRLDIPLTVGWSIVSMNIGNLPGAEFRAFFQAIDGRQHLEMVKDSQGRFYAPRIGFCNILMWKPLEGYQVKVNSQDTLTFEGDLTPETQPIALVEGWQIIAYLPNRNLPAPEAMSSLLKDSTLFMVKDEIGRFFIPDYGFDGIGEMMPGEGYYVCMKRDAILHYPRQRIATALMPNPPRPRHFIPPSPEERGMSVLLIAGQGVSDGDEAAFLSQSGRVLGSGVFTQGRAGVALWGDQEEPLPEPIIYRHATRSVEELKSRVMAGALEYSPNSFTALEVSVTPSPKNYDLALSLTPNPFNGRLTVVVSNAPGETVNLQVIDMLGRVVGESVVRIGMDRVETSIDLTEEASGVYLVKAQVGKRSITAKALLLR